MEPEPVHDMGNNLRSKHRSRAGECDDTLWTRAAGCAAHRPHSGAP